MKVYLCLVLALSLSMSAGVIHAQQDVPDLETIRTIGELTPLELISKLESMGDNETAEEFKQAFSDAVKAKLTEKGGEKAFASDVVSELNSQVGFAVFGSPKPWQLSGHAIGYLSPLSRGGAQTVSIVPANTISADTQELRNKRVIFRLDRVRVADYPGGDTNHTITIEINSPHSQTAGAPEQVTYNVVVNATEGSEVGTYGVVVFDGLNVGPNGPTVRVKTVNVENKGDKQLARFLESGPVKDGLNLLGTANPVIPIVTQYAKGVIDMFSKRNDNAVVQDFTIGFSFSTNPTPPKLKVGSYVIVQYDDRNGKAWDWSYWEYDTTTGRILDKATKSKLIPLNYVILSIEPAATQNRPQ